MLVYFSALVGRKVPKERHSRGSPTVPPLRNPPPDPRDTFAKGRKCLIARVVAKTRIPARSAERRPRGARRFSVAARLPFRLLVKDNLGATAQRVICYFPCGAAIRKRKRRLWPRICLGMSRISFVKQTHTDETGVQRAPSPLVELFCEVLALRFSSRHGEKGT